MSHGFPPRFCALLAKTERSPGWRFEFQSSMLRRTEMEQEGTAGHTRQRQKHGKLGNGTGKGLLG